MTQPNRQRSLFYFLAVNLLVGFGLVMDAPAQTSIDSGPITSGQQIFAAHHSYFIGVPFIMDEIAKSSGITDEKFVGDSYIGGSKSLFHWNIPDAQNGTKIALQTQKVDVLILTPIYLPDDGIEKFTEFGLKYNRDLRVTVQEFWLPFDVYNPYFYDPPRVPAPTTVDHNAATVESLTGEHTRYFEEMDRLVTSLNQKFGKQVIFVVPVGQAVIALRGKVIAGQVPGIKAQNELFRDALGHPQQAIQALIAYCHYAVIYRKSPIGLPVPKVLQSMRLSPGDESALNSLLQQLAWDAVTQHPLSGVKGS